MPQRAIPVMQFRGGSSKGLFFKAADLPISETERNRLILAAMEGVGCGDPRQIDGLGGATSLTSKVAVVSRSNKRDAGPQSPDLEYLFLQVVVGSGRVSTDQNCGNMLAAVLPFAIESGLFPASSPTTTARINLVSTGGICEVTVQTPGGILAYAGTAKVDGVPGTGAPILCNYLDIAGSTCGALLPTGKTRDWVAGVEVTCVDNGMPAVIIRATDVGVTGYESPNELEANEPLKQQLEHIRLAVGPLMNLGDVTQKTVPKLCLISAPRAGGMVNTRTFIPYRVHEAIGVLGAVSTATACLLPGSIADGIAILPKDAELGYSVEHPTGEFTIRLEQHIQDGVLQIGKSGVIRTARLLSRGDVMVPD